MAEFLSPGVFIQEVASGESAILGVSTSNFATVGWTPRGRENEAVLVTSLQDYFRKFGGFWANSDVASHWTAFFRNEGARGYHVRIVPDDAVAASGAVETQWLLNAISSGAWGDLVRVRIAGNDNFRDVATATFSRFDVEILEESVPGAGDFATVEFFESVSLSDDQDANYFPEVLNDEDTGSDRVNVQDGAVPGVPADFDSVQVLSESVGSGTGSQSEFSKTLVVPPVAPFTLKIQVDGNIEAQDDGRGNISLASSASGFTAVSGSIDYDTGDLVVGFTPAPLASASITADYYSAGVNEIVVDLSGGLDGTSVGRAQATNPALEADLKGLYAFNRIDEILNIGLGDFRGNEIIHLDLISYCETRGDCFAILDTPRGIDALGAKNYKQVTLGSLSEYAAVYHPGIQIADPLKDGKLKTISPVGHVAGVFARTDNNRNVGKAPAGVNEGALNFAVKLETVLSKGERDVIYPANVNPLISSPATGRAVWGARNLAITGDFTLVSTRRLFMFLEKSVFNSTHDLVFEPIGEDLFSTVNLRLTAFLTNLTVQGFFASRVPADAFRVVVDDTNNNSATRTQRLLVVDLFVAEQVPAEFILFRFQRLLPSA